jgi:TP901 family phage tail tape measure protein
MARELIIPFLITANYQTSLAIRQLRGELGQLPAELTALRAAAAEVYAIGAMGLFSLGMLAVGAQQLASSLLAAQRMAALAAVASSQHAAATLLATEILREAASVSRGSAASLEEISAAYLEAARAGLSLYESSSLLPDALKLAVTSGGEVAETFRMTFAILRNMGIPITQQTAKVLTSQLSYALDQSLMDIEDVMNAIKYVGPIAGQLRIPINDLFAALMLLHDAGIRGSIAGTGLARMLIRLEAPTQQAKKALAELGINWQELRPSGKNLADVIDLLAERADELTIRLLLGERAERAFYAIVTQGTGRLRELSQELYNAGYSSEYLQKKFDQLMRTPAFRMQRAMVDIRTMSMQLVEPLVRLQLILAEGLRDFLALITSSPALQIIAKMVIGFGSLGGTIALVSASLSWLIGRFLELGTIWHHLLLVLDRLQAAVRALTLSALKAPFIGIFEFFRALLTGGGIERLATWISERLRISELTSAIAQPLVFHRRARRIPPELQPLPEFLALQFGSMAAAVRRLGIPIETYLMAATTFAGMRATVPQFRVSKEAISELIREYYVTIFTDALIQRANQLAQAITGGDQQLVPIVTNIIRKNLPARIMQLATLIKGTDLISFVTNLQKEIVSAIATKDILLQPIKLQLMGIQPEDLIKRNQLAQLFASAMNEINAGIGSQLGLAVAQAIASIQDVQTAARVSLRAREMIDDLVRNAANIPIEDLESFMLSFYKGLQEVVRRINVQALPFLNEYQRKIQAILRQANVPGILRSFLMGAAALPTDALESASRIALGAMTGVAASKAKVRNAAQVIEALANEFGAYLNDVKNVSEAAAEIGIAFGLAAPHIAGRADILRLSRERLARLRDLERLRVLGVATAAQIEEMASLQRQVGLIGGMIASTQIRNAILSVVSNVRSSGLMAARLRLFYNAIDRLRRGTEFEPLIRAFGGLGMDIPEVIGRLTREGAPFYQHVSSLLRTLPDAELLRRLWFRFALNVMRAQRAITAMIDPATVTQIKDLLIKFGMSEAQANDVIAMLQSGILLFLAEQAALGKSLDEAVNAASGIRQGIPFVRRILSMIRSLFAPLIQVALLFRAISFRSIFASFVGFLGDLTTGIAAVFSSVWQMLSQSARTVIRLSMPSLRFLSTIAPILSQPFINLTVRLVTAFGELIRDILLRMAWPLVRGLWRVLVVVFWDNPLVQAILEFLKIFIGGLVFFVHETLRILIGGGAYLLYETGRVVAIGIATIAVEFWRAFLRPILVELFIKGLLLPLVRFVVMMLFRLSVGLFYGIAVPIAVVVRLASIIYRSLARPLIQFLVDLFAWVIRHLVSFLVIGADKVWNWASAGFQLLIKAMSFLAPRLNRLWNRLMTIPVIGPIMKILSALVKFPIDLADAIYKASKLLVASFASGIARIGLTVSGVIRRFLTSRIALRIPTLPAILPIVSMLVGKPLQWLSDLWRMVIAAIMSAGSKVAAPILSQLQRVPTFILGADIIRAVFSRTLGRTILKFFGMAGIGGLILSFILDMIPWEDIGRLFELSPKAQVYAQMSGRFIRTLLSSMVLAFVGLVKGIFYDLPASFFDSVFRLQNTLITRWRDTYETFRDAIYSMFYRFFIDAQRRIAELESSFQLNDIAEGFKRFADSIGYFVESQTNQFKRIQKSISEANELIASLYTGLGVAPPGIDERLTRIGELTTAFNLATSDLADFAEQSKLVGSLLSIVSDESALFKTALAETGKAFESLSKLPAKEWFTRLPPGMTVEETAFGKIVDEFDKWLIHGPQSIWVQLNNLQKRIQQLPEEQRRQLSGTLEWIEDAKRKIQDFGTLLHDAMQAPGEYKDAIIQASQELASLLSREQFRASVIEPIANLLRELQDNFAEFQKRLRELADPRAIREFANALAEIQFDYLTEGFRQSAEAASQFNEYMRELGLVAKLNERSADDLVYAYQAVMTVLSKPAARNPAEAFYLLRDAFSRVSDEAKTLKIDFQRLYQLLVQYNFMQITGEAATEIQRRIAELGKAIISAFREIRETLMDAANKFKEALDIAINSMGRLVFELNNILITSGEMTASFIDAAIENERRATQALIRELSFRAAEMRRHGATQQEIATALAAEWAKFWQSLRFARPASFKEVADLNQSIMNVAESTGDVIGELMVRNAELNNQLSFAGNVLAAAFRIISRVGTITSAAAEYLVQYYDALNKAIQISADLRVLHRGFSAIWEQIKEAMPSIDSIEDAIQAVSLFPLYLSAAISRISELSRNIRLLSMIPSWDAFLKRLQLFSQLRETIREIFASPEDLANQISRWTEILRGYIEQGWIPSIFRATMPEVRQIYLSNMMWLRQFYEEQLQILMQLSEIVPPGTKVWLELNQQIIETVENLGRIEEQLRNIRTELLSLELIALPERVAQFIVTQGPALFGFMRTGALGGTSTLQFNIYVSAQDVQAGIMAAMDQATRQLQGFTYRPLLW